MQITFREQWIDRRLAYDHLNLANTPKFLTVPHIKNSVWMPDTFFPVIFDKLKIVGEFYLSGDQKVDQNPIIRIITNLVTSRLRKLPIDT